MQISETADAPTGKAAGSSMDRVADVTFVLGRPEDVAVIAEA